MKTTKIAVGLALLSMSVAPLFAAKPNSNTKPYPYGNPVITHMYTADAAPHVLPDGRVWMVTSVDDPLKPTYNNMHTYHTFSTDDMVNWVDHGEVLSVYDVIGSDVEPEGEDWAIWAPDMIYENGKYYLYIPVRILIDGRNGAYTYTAVAVSDSPAERFEVIQTKIPDTKGIDPSAFRDDDGEIYLYYGPRSMATLADNMIEFDSEIKTLEIDSEKVLANDEKFQNMWSGNAASPKKGSGNYMEAPWMHKRNGVYQFNYHTVYGSTVKGHTDNPERRKSNLDFSYGNSPWGPLKYGGTLNYELGKGVEGGPRDANGNVPWRYTQSNHGAIVEFHGTDYLFYHTSALSSWRQDEFKAEGTWTQRSVCVDVIEYDENDLPLPVKQTVEGVAAVTVDQPFDVVLAKKSTTKGGVASFKNIDFGSGYYYFDVELPKGSEGKLEIRLDSADGQLVGTCSVTPEKLSVNSNLSETSIRDAKGKHTVYLVWKGESKEIKMVKPRILAGSPKKL